MGGGKKKITVLIVMIAIVACILFFLHSSSGRVTLERYKAELKAKGEKLTFKELGVMPSTNAEDIACREALNGCTNWMTGESPGSGTLTELMEFVAPGKARIGWRGQFHPDGGIPSKVGNWETLELRSDATASNLPPVIMALNHPAPDTGWIYSDDYAKTITGPRALFVRDRLLARLLAAETICELHRGKLEAAQNDLRALVALAEMNRNEYTLVHQMIRIAIGNLGLGATWEALQAPGWDEAHLKSLQMEWEREDFEEAVERGLIAERAHMQALMAWVRRANGRDMSRIFSFSSATKATNSAPATLSDILKSVPWIWYRASGAANEDELFQLKIFEEGLTLARDLRTNRPWCEVGPTASNIVNKIDHAIGKDRFHRLIVSSIAIPNYSRAFNTGVRTETLRRLTITAVAIKRYELKYGKAPPGLNALVPEFFAAVPIDPMSGKALCYRLKDDGAYLLYSVGEDGKDDGGDAVSANKSVTLDLWSGRDAVWPTAATDEEVAKAEAMTSQKTNKPN